MRKLFTAVVALAVVCVMGVEFRVRAATTDPSTRSGSAPSEVERTDDIYQAIRTNDLARLKALVATKADANLADQMGETPLMSAAAAGSLDAMTLLLEKGADVNAQNAFESTALVWAVPDMKKVQLLVERGANVNAAPKTGRTAAFVAAMTDESAPLVKMLAAKGADLKARDAFGNTILTAATIGNDLETIRTLVDAGVNVNAAGVTGMTPLIVAAYQGNTAAVKLLLAKGAKVNAVAAKPNLFPIDEPKSGPIALSQITPLLAGTASRSTETVRALLDAGANINAKDGRGMTALMVAVATNHQNPAIIRMLVDRGADATVQSAAGETAVDWARKLAVSHGVEILKIAARPSAAGTDVASPAIDAKTAAERSMALLESSSQKFFESSGCVSCHHQNITDMAASELRAKGWRVDRQAAIGRMKMLAAGPPPPLLLERMDINVPEIFAQTLTAIGSLNVPPDGVTDKLVANIAASQSADGSWGVVNGLGDRPPAEEASITRTALCIRALKVYGPPARGAEMTARITKARGWLASAAPVTSEDRNMQLLGLFWSGADVAALKPYATAILTAQQSDGGWRQQPGLASDAYATGQTLYVLAKTGSLPAADAAYQRGVKYLLATQAANGAWRVTSRSAKFQAYFNSGFPYAGDQWISAWATGWATMALAQ
jgi:ankyrin repeat protein